MGAKPEPDGILVRIPGSNGVKVTQTIVDNLSRVVEQSATPEEALNNAEDEVQEHLL